MFKINKKTLMEKILKDELKSFHEGNPSEDEHSEASDDFKNGNVLYKIPINKSYMTDLITTYKNPIHIDALDPEVKLNFHDARHDDGLFGNVTVSLIDIPVLKSYKECLDIIIDYKNALGKNFYGAILRTSNKTITINPFHILTALSVMEFDNYLAKQYNIIIYAYHNREQLDLFMKTNIADYDKINLNIDSLMNSYVSKVRTITRLIKQDNSVDTSLTYYTVNKQTKKFPDEDQSCSHYIVANQLLTKGILAPFYGATLVKQNGTPGGLRLTPFGSCNISSDDNCQIEESTEPSYGSVCTGSLNNRTLKGMRSLSHANLGSPYGGGYIQNGALAYADTMIERCIDIYESANLLTKDKNIRLDVPEYVKPENPLDTFSKAELECGTLFEYFKLCQSVNHLPSSSIDSKTRYQAMKEYRESLSNVEELAPIEFEIHGSLDTENTDQSEDPLEIQEIDEVDNLISQLEYSADDIIVLTDSSGTQTELTLNTQNSDTYTADITGTTSLTAPQEQINEETEQVQTEAEELSAESF